MAQIKDVKDYGLKGGGDGFGVHIASSKNEQLICKRTRGEKTRGSELLIIAFIRRRRFVFYKANGEADQRLPQISWPVRRCQRETQKQDVKPPKETREDAAYTEDKGTSRYENNQWEITKPLFIVL